MKKLFIAILLTFIAAFTTFAKVTKIDSSRHQFDYYTWTLYFDDESKKYTSQFVLPVASMTLSVDFIGNFTPEEAKKISDYICKNMYQVVTENSIKKNLSQFGEIYTVIGFTKYQPYHDIYIMYDGYASITKKQPE